MFFAAGLPGLNLIMSQHGRSERCELISTDSWGSFLLYLHLPIYNMFLRGGRGGARVRQHEEKCRRGDIRSSGKRSPVSPCANRVESLYKSDVQVYSQFTNVAVSDFDRSADAYHTLQQAKEQQDDTCANSASQQCHRRLVMALSRQNVRGALHSGKIWLLMTVCNPILFSTDCKDT